MNTRRGTAPDKAGAPAPPPPVRPEPASSSATGPAAVIHATDHASYRQAPPGGRAVAAASPGTPDAGRATPSVPETENFRTEEQQP
ncbi:hypothetical protein [Streptomyces sp. Wb2n-11]|uniref:hypothetical protein n=1 Tax=Streptomyces sp. Wb2n-11 TaxID=1030533 RepID=UPI000AAB64A3|nr:hypothetical protein [Streptomyces sp. Wb2n-11]